MSLSDRLEQYDEPEQARGLPREEKSLNDQLPVTNCELPPQLAPLKTTQLCLQSVMEL